MDLNLGAKDGDVHIKKIGIAELRPGMYVHEINCPWWDHPYLSNRFPVTDEATAAEVRRLGIREIYIDTRKGMDVARAVTRAQVDQTIERDMRRLAAGEAGEPSRIALVEARPEARKLHAEANRVVRAMMRDARLGRRIEMEEVEPLVERMLDSIFRNADALLPLTRLKARDDYTFQHSVSVCALMIAFGRGLGLERPAIRQIAIGALLHDVGKARLPDEILNKPARLSDAEFASMKSHVTMSVELLRCTPGIGQEALEVAGEHHERFDGGGYPNRLKGDGISLHGRMAAIADVYDAIASDRVYHKRMPPPAAMGKLLEWSQYHFDPQLVRGFIKSVGIYPSGSLVRLESGRLAVVTEQNRERLLQPAVRVIYQAARQRYLPPEAVNLAGPDCQDRIVGHESFAAWGIDPLIGLA